MSIRLSLTALFLAFFCACKNPLRNENPKELVFAVIPSDDMLQTTKYTVNFSRYLERELGIRVKYFTATDYTAVIEAIRSNKCHICILGPFSYLIAAQRADAEAVVSLGTRQGKMYTYSSILLASSQSNIHTISDFVANASRLTLTFTDPASTSGHLIPRAFIESLGLNPEKSFASCTFASSHAASVLSVLSGNVDVGAASSETVRRLKLNNQLDEQKFNILWQSPPIPRDPICVRRTLPKSLKDRIVKAFINAHINDTATFNHYVRYTYQGSPLIDSFAFMPASDSNYNGLREIAKRTNMLK